MEKYVKLSDIKKYPIRIDHYDKENGDLKFVSGVESLMEYIECLPNYKTEVSISKEINKESLIQEIDYLLNSGMGKKKALERLREYINNAETKEE